jgi:uncharacterized protein (TIGR00251 family)
VTARGRTCARRSGDHVGAATFEILVQPRASRAQIGPRHDGRIKVSVTSPPVDGEANDAVIELIADALGVAKRAVTVVAGASSRRKTIRVEGVTTEQVEELCE